MAKLFRRDTSGIAEILKSPEMRAALHSVADPIAANIRAQKPDMEGLAVDDYTTDRAAVSITILDVRGKLWQVRDGILTRAAAAAGLEVTERA